MRFPRPRPISSVSLDMAVTLTAYTLAQHLAAELQPGEDRALWSAADQIVCLAYVRLARAELAQPLTELERYMIAAEQLRIWGLLAYTPLGTLTCGRFDRALAEAYATAFECAAELF